MAGLPIDTFHALLDTSLTFNRFVLRQPNERLGQFIAAVEIDRLEDTDSRVARGRAALGLVREPVVRTRLIKTRVTTSRVRARRSWVSGQPS